MIMSEEIIKQKTKQHGYRPEILEKVIHLLDLLEDLNAVPYLSDRLVLKGGTAINLFCAEALPRLSIDLDFNYIGSLDREIMQKEKIELEAMILEVCQRRRYSLHRHPRAHAGGKMVLIYESTSGNKGRLELDINYIFRIPLWEPEQRFSPTWPKRTETKVLDIHELAAGKLHALLGREASRDLFDSCELLTKWPIDRDKLRLAFTVYAGMERDGWQAISVDNVKYTVKDIREQLIPVLHQSRAPSFATKDISLWAEHLVKETKEGLLRYVLPFNANEIEFLNCLHQHKEIRPELISKGEEFCRRVRAHPALLWRVQKII